MASRSSQSTSTRPKAHCRQYSGTGTFGTNTSGELQLRNLTVAPGSSPLKVSFSVVTPCTGGSGTWKAPGKQSNNFLGNGNDFALVQSGGLTSSVGSGGCKLVWLYPPNHANKNATITNTAYTPTVGGTVHNVAVQAVAADGVTPLDLNIGTATLGQDRRQLSTAVSSCGTSAD